MAFAGEVGRALAAILERVFGTLVGSGGRGIAGGGDGREATETLLRMLEERELERS